MGTPQAAGRLALKVSMPSKQPSLLGWVLRDTTITLVLGLICWACTLWYTSSSSWLAAAAGAGTGFIAAYVVCYICHEWGHLIGALATRSTMPLNSYAGAAIGRFDISSHSTRQFLALSWGGVAGYVFVAAVTLVLYTSSTLAWVGAGLAVGGLAFVSQSLAVDLPQIWRVRSGADAAQTNASGASAKVILQRTWQSWLILAVALLAYNRLIA
jgi:hypothetical protein